MMTSEDVCSDHDICEDDGCPICQDVLRPVEPDGVRRGRWVCFPLQTFYDESVVPINKTCSSILYLFAKVRTPLTGADVACRVSYKGAEINDPNNLFHVHLHRMRNKLKAANIPIPLHKVSKGFYIFDIGTMYPPPILLGHDEPLNDETDSSALTLGKWVVSSSCVRYDQILLKISSHQCRLLRAVAGASRPMSADAIGEICTERHTDKPKALFAVHYCRLKKRLNEQNIPNPLESVWGVGYQWSKDHR